MIDRTHDWPTAARRATRTVLCACGQPLHYSSPGIQDTIEQLIRQLGPTVRVTAGKQRYDVSRHYIALHGIRTQDLAALARQGIVTEVTE